MGELLSSPTSLIVLIGAVEVVRAARVPTMEPSVSRGTTTMPRTSQLGWSHEMDVCEATCWRPVEMTWSARATTSGSCWSASPSQARVSPLASVMVSAQVSSSWRR